MTQSLASGELGKVDIELESGSTIKIESHTGKSMRRTLDEVTELARTKNSVASSGLLKERASAQLQLGRAEAILRSGRLLLLDPALYQRLTALDHDEMRSEDLTLVRESPFVGRALDWNQLDDAWNIAR